MAGKPRYKINTITKPERQARYLMTDTGKEPDIGKLLPGIPVELCRSPKARAMSVRITVDRGRFVVTVPERATARSIENFVRRSSGWIFTHKPKLRATVPFLSGHEIPIGGLPHLILTAEDERGLPYLREEASSRQLVVPGDPAFTPRRVSDFLRRRAKEQLTERSLDHAKAIGVRPSRITVKDTTSRWGSCSTTRALSFSWRLVLAPETVLDYVAAHEVAHLREMNHGPRFWKIVEDLVPDMQDQMSWLKQHGADLYRYGGSG